MRFYSSSICKFANHLYQETRQFLLEKVIPNRTLSFIFINECRIPVVYFFNQMCLNSLFRKKRFEINFFVWQNASKFAIFIEKENPCSFFRFSFRAFLSFTYVDIDQGIHKVKVKVARNEKQKKLCGFYFFSINQWFVDQ